MHPFEKPFYRESYRGDGNMLEQFQPIPVHGFQEICQARLAQKSMSAKQLSEYYSFNYYYLYKYKTDQFIF